MRIHLSDEEISVTLIIPFKKTKGKNFMILIIPLKKTEGKIL